MNAYSKRPQAIWLLLFALLFACNYPAATAPTPLFPTPDATMTAIYSVIETATALASNQPVLPAASFTPEVQVPTSEPPALETPTTAPTALPSATATLVPPTAVPATAIVKPTNTPISYVGPSARNAPKILAYYLQREPTIDGVFDEWALDRYTVSSVVYGKGNWKGEADLSGTVMFGWDDNYLYIAARVKDDTYVQNVTSEKIFRGDSVEVLVDTNVSKDFYLDELDKDDYQLGLSAGRTTLGNSPEAYLWFPKGKAGGTIVVKLTGLATDNGYRIEAKIPWSLFGINNPNIGTHLGFVFSISDNDKSGENSQQSMVSTSASRVLTDPTTWGDLELLGNP